MKIRLDEARFEPLRWTERIDLTDQELGPGEGVEVGPVECTGNLSFSAPDFLLHAHLRYSQSVACDRCLKPVPSEVESDLDLVVSERRRGAQSDSGERELEESDLGWIEVSGGQLETRPLVVEQVALNVPTKLLCREDCRGLCPTCGRDLNEESCACAEARVDPRWSALGALKDGTSQTTKGKN